MTASVNLLLSGEGALGH